MKSKRLIYSAFLAGLVGTVFQLLLVNPLVNKRTQDRGLNSGAAEQHMLEG